MRKLVVTLTGLLFCSVLLGDDIADRGKLAGTWQLQKGSDKDGSVWTLESKGDGVHIVRLQANQKLTDFECNTLGRDCDVTETGHHVKLSIWYNGPKLVQLETRGSEVVKWRLAVTGQGDTMEVEEIPVTPEGKTEILEFKRVLTTSAH